MQNYKLVSKLTLTCNVLVCGQNRKLCCTIWSGLTDSIAVVNISVTLSILSEPVSCECILSIRDREMSKCIII